MTEQGTTTSEKFQLIGFYLTTSTNSHSIVYANSSMRQLCCVIWLLLGSSSAKVAPQEKVQVASATYVDGKFQINKGHAASSVSDGVFIDERSSTG